MNLDQFEEKVNIKKAKSDYDLKYEIGTLITFGRIQSGLSQENLAKRLKTKQPSIARVESGKTLPSLSFLEKIAKAVGMNIEVKFTSVNKKSESPTEEVTHTKFTESIPSPYPYVDGLVTVSSSLLTN